MTRKSFGVVVGTVFVLLLLLFIYSVAEILLLLFISVVFSLYLGAITDALQRRLSVPRPIGLTAAILATVLAVVGVGFLIVPPVVQQTQDLLATLPKQLETWERMAEKSQTVSQLLGPVQEGRSYVGAIMQQIGSYFRGVVPYVFSGLTFLVDFVSVLVMGIYMTLRPAMYREGFIALAPPAHRELVRDILTDLGVTLRAWIVGQGFAMLTLGVLTWVGLMLIRVPYALAFGVFTGIAAIVPFFGTLVSTLLPAVFVLGAGSLGKALLVVMLGIIVHLFEANVVAPMVMERQVALPPVLTLLSVLVMAHLLGLIGLLVAVPVLAVVMVIIRRVYIHRVLEGKGFRRSVRDQPVDVHLPAEGVLVHPSVGERTVPTMLEEQR
jgi:predicted PurR-regulated permease PerM